MNENFNYCHIVGKTDVGRKRTANEDNMYNAITKNGLVSVVCDGMGGHVGGATASSIAVTTIINNLNETYYDDPRIAIGESIDKANIEVLRKTEEQPELLGMGSTCVLLLIRDGKVFYGHVGDSRIYFIRNKKIKQLTKDHSYVQMLVDCGEITQEEAEMHPRKNEITNALGLQNMAPATVSNLAITPEAGDCFVLCSDGLSGMVSDKTICKVISEQSRMSAQERVDYLVDTANKNGGVDNITIQLVEFSVSPKAVLSKKQFSMWAKIVCGVIILAAIGIGGYLWYTNNPKPDINNITINPEAAVNNLFNNNDVDTIAKTINTIKFEKEKEIVELGYSGSKVMFMRNNKVFYTENDSLDKTSLFLETKNVEPKYDKLVLRFTKKNPGDNVVFYISTINKSKVYKYIIEISSEKNDGTKDTEKNRTKGGNNAPNAEPADTEITSDSIRHSIEKAFSKSPQVEDKKDVSENPDGNKLGKEQRREWGNLWK